MGPVNGYRQILLARPTDVLGGKKLNKAHVSNRHGRSKFCDEFVDSEYMQGAKHIKFVRLFALNCVI